MTPQPSGCMPPFAGWLTRSAALLLLAAAIPVFGQNVRLLHTFAPGKFQDINTFTNSDGVQPVGGLVLSGGTLYGVANFGGSGGVGTVFAINTNGGGFAVSE